VILPQIESELSEVNTNSEALRRNFLELSELKEVLKKTQVFFAEVCNIENFRNE
jgi:V-type H+-transporting ATPase subunit a